MARGRGVSVEAVRKNMGQGRMLRGDAARTAEMINGVATFDEVVNRMQGTVRGVSPAPQRQPAGRSALRAAQNELALLDDAPAQMRNSVAALRREVQLLALE